MKKIDLTTAISVAGTLLGIAGTLLSNMSQKKTMAKEIEKEVQKVLTKQK